MIFNSLRVLAWCESYNDAVLFIYRIVHASSLFNKDDPRYMVAPRWQEHRSLVFQCLLGKQNESLIDKIDPKIREVENFEPRLLLSKSLVQCGVSHLYAKP